MRSLLRTFAILALFPYVGIVALLVTGSASWSSVAYVAAAGLLLGGLVTLPDPENPGAKRRRRPRGLSRAGALAIVAVMGARACTAGSGRSMRVTADHGASGSRVVNRLVDEGDMALLGARVMQSSGLYGDDSAEVGKAMRAAYADMRRAEGQSPSPVVATYLGLQSPDAFDTILLEPPEEKASAAVVFLHGYAGSFDLPCFQIARAVAGLGVTTACPSTRWVGDWWSPDGEAILRRTVSVLRARGVSRFVLAGLSNGGYGASELAPKMKGTFAGMILVSGAQPDQPSPGTPVLLLHGANDNVAPVEDARAYARKYDGRLVELDAGHFAMLVRSEQVNREIRAFVVSTLGSVRTAALDGPSTP